uniref:Large ribosomal subunit protein bL32m n=1 Tax=Zonotrichia albicollis TaxID=44394 RepID=A0A8D2N641_ZONAL
MLGSAEAFYMLLILWCPKLHTVFKGRLRQYRAEWDNHAPLFLSPAGPALAVQGAALVPQGIGDAEAPSLPESVVWMAAPKHRRTIEVNRCRRRNPNKLIEIKRNIDVCPECGNLKQKHVLCGYCYAKVKEETQLIRMEIKKKEGGPFNAPTVETVVLYEGEKPTEKDEGKRIIERARKRPSWFVQN